jgi:predicted esterase
MTMRFSPLSRREFCRALGASALTYGCTGVTRGTDPGPFSDARLKSRPGVPPTGAVTPGIQALSVPGDERQTWLLVPTGYDPATAWPLAIFFRGAITLARTYMDAFLPFADEFGLIILAPEATYRTWDLVLGGFGPDVLYVDAALAATFKQVHVDPARVSACGFSDGGSYSLSLGVTNGDFLTRIAAYSPGFLLPASRHGQPEFFITHGTLDTVLPIDSTSRPIVSQLRGLNYEVDYREFDGPHAVSLTLAKESIEWMSKR